MKVFVSIVFLLVLALPALFKSGLVVWYQLNKTTITIEFCENKDKPELECNGQCHLKKELERVSPPTIALKTERNQTPPIFNQADYTVFLMPTQPKMPVSVQMGFISTPSSIQLPADPVDDIPVPPPEPVNFS